VGEGKPFSPEGCSAYLKDMADKQVKLGGIESQPDFLTTRKINDSALRKAAAELGLK
jgi:hypothetical protein